MRSVTQKLLLFAAFLAAAGAVLLCVAYAHRPVPVYTVQRVSENPIVLSANSADLEEKLNINKATREQIESLPGLGEVLAERIISYRREHGGFYDVGELREVEGIGDKLLESLLPYICT